MQEPFTFLRLLSTVNMLKIALQNADSNSKWDTAMHASSMRQLG